MNKRVTLKLRRRILAFAMAFVLVMTSIVTIPELGMKAQAADGTISYGVTITGGKGAVVDEFEFNLVFKNTITPYDGTSKISLQTDELPDNMRLKQWNVLVDYGNYDARTGIFISIASYAQVLTGNLFEGTKKSKLDLDGRAALSTALKSGDVFCKISISAVLENKYAAISFDGNGATAGSMEGTSIEKDTAYTLPNCGFTKERCQFNGWMLGDTVYQPGAEVTITKDTTFTATWLELYATVSFDGNGATSGTQDAVFVEKGTSYALPTCSFTKNGYQFAGWKLDDSHVYQTGDEITITENVTFTALWEELFDITLSANFETYGSVTGDGSYVAGKTVTVKATPYVGHMFVNWTEDGEVVSTDSEYTFNVSKDRDLVANFAVKCSIAFNGDGGSGSMETIYVAEGSSYTLPECGFGSPAEWRYFAGWNRGKPGDVITITTNIVLVAQWAYKTYPVTITVDPEGTGTVDGAGYYKKDDRVDVVAYPNPGFEFDHWEITGEEETITDSDYVFEMPAHAVELKAVFKRVAYPVHFAANGGDGTMRDVYISMDGAYILPTCGFSKSWYTFDHWKAVIGTTTVDNLQPGAEITVTDETTIYAIWKPITLRVSARSISSAGSTAGSDTEGTYGCEVTVRATPAEHYHFVGWEVGSTIVSTDPVYTFTLMDDIILYANFEEDEYPVSFDANGGSGEMLSALITYGDYYTLPECAFTAPEGKTFGWWEKNGEKYYPGKGFYVYDSVTLKAVWVNDLEPIEISEANFPDVNFRDILASYDEDHDGFFSAAEIASITSMSAFDNSIADLTGIGYFTELKSLDCGRNELSSLDLSGLEKLEILYCTYNPFTSLSLANNRNLIELDASECHSLASLNLANNTELEVLCVRCDVLASLNLSNNMKLKEIDIYSINTLTSIDLSGHDKLETLNCNGCSKVETLNLTGCTALKNLDVSYMYALTELNLNGLTALEELSAGTLNAITSVTISNLSSLKKLKLAGSRTTASLTLSNLPNLEELTITETKLTSIDVSSFPNLQKLSVLSNDELESITFGSVAASLKELDISYDKALTVNFASFKKLEKLFCIDCGLTTLDARGLSKLCSLTCRSNKLTSLNIDGLTDLELVDCRFNQLESLNISSSPKLLADPTRYVYRDSSVTLITDKPYDGTLVITNVNIVLQNNLAIQFFADKTPFAKDGYEAPFAVFNVNGKEKTVQATLDGSNYVFACNNIAPQMVGDKIDITIYVKKGDLNVRGMSFSYSVKDYCDYILQYMSSDVKLRTLIVDLLNYGAATQTYANYKTDALVNKDLTTTQQGWATDERDYVSVAALTNVDAADLSGVSITNMSLVLNETVAIRYFFTATSISGLTLEIKDDRGQTWTFGESDFVHESDNYYHVDFRKLQAKRMSDVVYATFHKGSQKTSTAVYSIESYVALTGDGTSNIHKLLKAMMNYGDAAKAYASH